MTEHRRLAPRAQPCSSTRMVCLDALDPRRAAAVTVDGEEPAATSRATADILLTESA